MKVHTSFILVKHHILTLGFQIKIAVVNNTNMSEDKNRAIIYKMAIVYRHGFMQEQIIASHICFDGHMDVNC